MAAAPMNLSLLSRGVGEVKTNGHEKIDVKLEPEDYYNWLDDPRREWNVTKVIPPIPSLTPRLTRPSQPSTRAPPPSQAYYSQDFTPRSCFSNDSKQSEVYLPKTFTTRKGALLLFSEDLAQRRAKRIRHRLARSADDSKLNTVEDLAKSILSYGAKQTFSHEAEDITLDDRVYMGFGNDRSRRYFERQYKPGFSAKRYLASWTKHWNYTVFENITKKGYLKTNTRLLKKSEFDVSGIPLPYRILRQWLFAPGTLDGYTFYRQRQPSMIRENTIEEDGRPGTEKEAVVPGDIVITSINDNKEVDYANLDSSTKETILTELLVKSAITHAINKQKEFQEAVAADPALEAAASSQLFQFDMMKAIESALEQPVLPTVNTLSMKADEFLPVNPPIVQKKGFRGARGVAGVKSQSEESMSGSIRSLDSIGSENLDRKYKKVPPIRKPSRQPGNYYFTSEMENDRQEEPIIQKPPIIPTQSHKSDSIYININIEPPTPQHSFILGQPGLKGGKKSARRPLLSEGNIGEEDDRRFDDYDDLTNNLRNTRKSQSLQSIHTVNMEVGLDSEDETDKKSVLSVASIMSRRSRVSGNDAKSLSYSQGITARQDPRSKFKVGGPTGDFDPSGALTSWKYEGEERPESAQKFISQLTKDVESAAPSLLDESEIPQSALSSRISPYSVPGQEGETPVILPTHDVSEAEATSQISEGEFLEVITEQAREIAKNILNSNPESGHDLASDAKKAAELLMSNIPSEANTTRDQSEAVSETGEGDDEEAYGGGTTIADAMLAGMEEFVPQIDEVYGDPIRGSKNTTRESSAHPSDGSYSIAGTEGKTPSIIDRTPSIGSVHTNTPDASRPSSDKTIRASIPSATSALPAVPEDTALTEFKSKPPSSKAESVIQAEHTAALVENPTGEITKSPEKSTSAVSKKSSDKGSRKEIGVDHEKEFVVGKVKDKTETALYTPLESPPKLKEKKTGKAAEPKTVKKTSQKVKPSPGKKQSKGTKSKAKPEKKVVIPAPKEPTPIPPPPKTPTPEPVKQPTPTPSPEYEEWKTPSPVEEEDMEFIIVRDDESDEEEADETSVKLGLGSVKSLNFSNKSPTTGTSSKLSTDDEFDYSDEEFESTGISNKDAQAAKRAAAKEKRRREVERRRREREDAVKKEKEDAERKERIRLQMEEDRVRREEEVRLRKEREREERDREERAEEEKMKKEREAQERERKRQEEIAKYMAEKKRKAEEEEARRKVLQAAREAEEAERRRLEQLMLAEMEEEERKDYLKRKEEEERLRKIQEEEARVRREEEARLIYEEIQRQEEERKRGEELLRQRLLFQRSLNVESHGLDHTQDISRAFVFSYYELLKWLGYEIPEWVKYGPTAGHSNHAESEQ